MRGRLLGGITGWLGSSSNQQRNVSKRSSDAFSQPLFHGRWCEPVPHTSTLCQKSSKKASAFLNFSQTFISLLGKGASDREGQRCNMPHATCHMELTTQAWSWGTHVCVARVRGGQFVRNCVSSEAFAAWVEWGTCGSLSVGGLPCLLCGVMVPSLRF